MVPGVADRLDSSNASELRIWFQQIGARDARAKDRIGSEERIIKGGAEKINRILIARRFGAEVTSGNRIKFAKRTQARGACGHIVCLSDKPPGQKMLDAQRPALRIRVSALWRIKLERLPQVRRQSTCRTER